MPGEWPPRLKQAAKVLSMAAALALSMAPALALSVAFCRHRFFDHMRSNLADDTENLVQLESGAIGPRIAPLRPVALVALLERLAKLPGPKCHHAAKVPSWEHLVPAWAIML